ncbi:MAG: outer membrane lipoprotein-sorting protein [Gammaproteobacteria bacterium]|nr:MAG: outer membrane lipoprotein-sorting protein [Gammaproteobacteria bacterium]
MPGRLAGILCGLLLLGLGCPPARAATGGDGAALARQIHDRPAGRDMVSRALMLLSDRHAQHVRRRLFYTYRIDRGGGVRRTLVRFLSPAEVRDTGLLSLSRPGGRVEQWLYLPALGRVRRIASSRRGGRFAGSDLYYEDLQDRDPDQDVHRLAGRGKVGGIACDILVSTPRDPGASVYTKRVSWILRRALVPLRVDYYRKGRRGPVKRYLVHRLRRIHGYWTVLDSTMTNLRTGHRTRVLVQAVRYDQGLPETLFTRRGLADPALEVPYRP